MRTETKRLLEDFLTHQEYKLDEAKRAWDTAAQRIQTMPNLLNVFGVWQADQLHDLTQMRVIVMERDQLCRELRAFIETPKPRFRNLKKVPKARKKKTARL